MCRRPRVVPSLGFPYWTWLWRVRAQGFWGAPPGHAALNATVHEGVNGGGIVMRWLATDSPARSAQEPTMSDGMTRLLPLVNPTSCSTLSRQRNAAPFRCGARQFGGGLWWGEPGVWTVSTLSVTDWAVPVPYWPVLGMFPGESSVCKVRNPVRVPPRAQCFRRSGAFFVFLRVHIVHTLASDLMFRVSGVPERPIRLCGGAAAYGGPGTALCDLFWVFILVRPSVGFTRTPIHCGQGRAQHDLLNILQIDRGLRPVRNFRSLIPVHAGTRGGTA